MKIEQIIINDVTCEYKCYDILRKILRNEKYYEYLKQGILTNKVYGFTSELWEKIRCQNIRRINSFEDVFIIGANIGYCTVTSKQLSYSFNDCYICGGVLPILIGTNNCFDGSHTWISKNGYIIDTTLMLIIEENYAKILGYQEENRYNPNLDSIYCAIKDFTNDKSIKNKIKSII